MQSPVDLSYNGEKYVHYRHYLPLNCLAVDYSTGVVAFRRTPPHQTLLGLQRDYLLNKR